MNNKNIKGRRVKQQSSLCINDILSDLKKVNSQYFTKKCSYINHYLPFMKEEAVDINSLTYEIIRYGNEMFPDNFFDFLFNDQELMENKIFQKILLAYFKSQNQILSKHKVSFLLLHNCDIEYLSICSNEPEILQNVDIQNKIIEKLETCKNNSLKYYLYLDFSNRDTNRVLNKIKDEIVIYVILKYSLFKKNVINTDNLKIIWMTIYKFINNNNLNKYDLILLHNALEKLENKHYHKKMEYSVGKNLLDEFYSKVSTINYNEINAFTEYYKNFSQGLSAMEVRDKIALAAYVRAIKCNVDFKRPINIFLASTKTFILNDLITLANRLHCEPEDFLVECEESVNNMLSYYKIDRSSGSISIEDDKICLQCIFRGKNILALSVEFEHINTIKKRNNIIFKVQNATAFKRHFYLGKLDVEKNISIYNNLLQLMLEKRELKYLLELFNSMKNNEPKTLINKFILENKNHNTLVNQINFDKPMKITLYNDKNQGFCYKIYEEGHLVYRRYEQEKKDNKDTSGFKNMIIVGISDFLVKTVDQSCIRKKHKLEAAQGIVNIINGGNIVEKTFNALYCPECKVCYISRDEYVKISCLGTLCCNLITSEEYINYIEKKTVMCEKSILAMHGYNVNQKDNLSSAKRHEILSYIITNKILTPWEIVKHLDYLINRKTGEKDMSLAIEKWREDRDFVLKVKNGNKKFRVKNMYLKSYKYIL